MVGGVDHPRAVEQAIGFEGAENAADLFVEKGDQAEIAGDGELAAFVGAQGRVVVPVLHHALHPGMALEAVARHHFGQVDPLRRVQVEIFLRHHQRHVRRHQAQEQHPRLGVRRGGALPQPVHREIGDARVIAVVARGAGAEFIEQW